MGYMFGTARYVDVDVWDCGRTRDDGDCRQTFGMRKPASVLLMLCTVWLRLCVSGLLCVCGIAVSRVFRFKRCSIRLRRWMRSRRMIVGGFLCWWRGSYWLVIGWWWWWWSSVFMWICRSYWRTLTGRRGEEGHELHAGVSAAAGRPGKLLCFQRCV